MLAALPTVIDEEPKSWEAKARCRDGSGALTHLFFSEELQDIARAKNLCAECPAMLTCLEGAIARREPWGVWGGELLLNGRIVTSKRACGRPPKHPRPALVIDELGVVPVESVA